MGRQLGHPPIANDTPSMEAQQKALRETAIAVAKQAIAYHKSELARRQADLAEIKQRTGIYAR